MKDSAKKIKEKVHEGTRTPFEFSLSLSLPVKLIRGPIMNDKKNIETVRFVKQ